MCIVLVCVAVVAVLVRVRKGKTASTLLSSVAGSAWHACFPPSLLAWMTYVLKHYLTPSR